MFAEQLATQDLVPVSSSPIGGASLTTLVVQGTAWTVSCVDTLFHNPLQGLGLLLLSEVGMTVAAVSRAARETFVIAVKYRLRERLGIPSTGYLPRIVAEVEIGGIEALVMIVSVDRPVAYSIGTVIGAFHADYGDNVWLSRHHRSPFAAGFVPEGSLI